MKIYKAALNIFNFIFDIFIYYCLIWLGGISISLAYVFPMQSIVIIIFSVIAVGLPKIRKRLKTNREEEV